MKRELQTAIRVYQLAKDQKNKPEGKTARRLLHRIMSEHGITMKEILQETPHSAGSHRIEAPVPLYVWETHLQLSRFLGYSVAVSRGGDLLLHGKQLGHALSLAATVQETVKLLRTASHQPLEYLLTLPIYEERYSPLVYQRVTQEELLAGLVFSYFQGLRKKRPVVPFDRALRGPAEWDAPPRESTPEKSAEPEKPAPPEKPTPERAAEPKGACTGGEKPLPETSVQAQMRRQRETAVELASLINTGRVGWRLQAQWRQYQSYFLVGIGDIFPQTPVPRSHWLKAVHK